MPVASATHNLSGAQISPLFTISTSTSGACGSPRESIARRVGKAVNK